MRVLTDKQDLADLAVLRGAAPPRVLSTASTSPSLLFSFVPANLIDADGRAAYGLEDLCAIVRE